MLSSWQFGRSPLDPIGSRPRTWKRGAARSGARISQFTICVLGEALARHEEIWKHGIHWKYDEGRMWTLICTIATQDCRQLQTHLEFLSTNSLHIRLSAAMAKSHRGRVWVRAASKMYQSLTYAIVCWDDMDWNNSTKCANPPRIEPTKAKASMYVPLQSASFRNR